MSIEALPFVNWIFWTALSAGTLLVVGVTELLGGTTSGYRLFMAWLLAAFAAVLLLSELTLSSGTAVDASTETRRMLVLAFAAVTAAYLIAMARLPRAGLAIAGGLVGVLALATLAAGSPTLSPLLFSVQLALAALALGAVNAAMLLGHWYLVTPKLSPAPLRRMMWLLLAALLLQVLIFVVAVVTVSSGPLGGPIGWLTWLRLAVGILLPIGITVLAILASRAPSLQASTGLLYISLAFIMAGSIAAASITYLTGVPIWARCRSRSAPLPSCASFRPIARCSRCPIRPGSRAHGRPWPRRIRPWRRIGPSFGRRWAGPMRIGRGAVGWRRGRLPAPVSGGATMTLTDEAIDVAALEERLAGPGHGAVVTFVGRARNTADDGREVLELEYDVYPEMAIGVLTDIATEAESRWGAAVGVAHRTGLVPIGEAAVAIVTAAPHRSAAYEANRYVIEAIRSGCRSGEERFADGSEWKRPGA